MSDNRPALCIGGPFHGFYRNGFEGQMIRLVEAPKAVLRLDPGPLDSMAKVELKAHCYEYRHIDGFPVYVHQEIPESQVHYLFEALRDNGAVKGEREACRMVAEYMAERTDSAKAREMAFRIASYIRDRDLGL